MNTLAVFHPYRDRSLIRRSSRKRMALNAHDLSLLNRSHVLVRLLATFTLLPTTEKKLLSFPGLSLIGSGCSASFCFVSLLSVLFLSFGLCVLLWLAILALFFYFVHFLRERKLVP
jgi:hypothetical protein